MRISWKQGASSWPARRGRSAGTKRCAARIWGIEGGRRRRAQIRRSEADCFVAAPEALPLSARLRGERGGAHAKRRGRVRWAAPLFGVWGSPHLTPTLSAPEGGAGDVAVAC